MPRFRYKAATADGEVVEGDIEAASEAAVVRHLQAQGQVPIRAELLGAAAPGAAGGPAWLRRRTTTPRERMVFTVELAALLQAGLPVDRALDLLAGLSDPGPMRDLLREVHADVRAGADLSKALAARDGVFSRFFVNMVRAGEASGALDQALARLAEFLERAAKFRETLVSALLYPGILAFVALLSLAVILGVVVPRVAELFADAGQALPWYTQVVVGAGSAVERWGWLAGIGIALAYVGLRHKVASPEGRLEVDRVVLALPVVGSLVARAEAARFTRTLGTLLSNGVTLLDALTIAREIVVNRVVAEGLADVGEQVRKGEGLARPLLESGVFPALAAHLVRVGEETGSLDTMLLKLADIYEGEVQTVLARMVALLGPVLILCLGAFIAFVMLSIVVPILGINELAL